MGHQISAIYKLTGPDGTRIVFNDSLDADFVGYLKDVGGLESAEVRESSEDIPEADGADHGDFFEGRRGVTLEGFLALDPAASRNERLDRLMRATRALRADAELRWAEAGRPETRIYLRRQQRPIISGLRPKEFLVAMVAEDPRITSVEQLSVNLDPGEIGVPGSGADFGFEFDLGFDVDFQQGEGGGGGSGTLVDNLGNGDAVPDFRVDGPITNPRLINNTTGRELRINYSLAAGEWLYIDGQEHTIRLNGTHDRYSALDFAASEWWTIQPRLNDVRLLASSWSAPAAMTVFWAHTWS